MTTAKVEVERIVRCREGDDTHSTEEQARRTLSKRNGFGNVCGPHKLIKRTITTTEEPAE